MDEWRPYDLPPEAEAPLLALMDFYGLNYGAADFILTPDGRHVFLELNPSGEFFWLEHGPGSTSPARSPTCCSASRPDANRLRLLQCE